MTKIRELFKVKKGSGEYREKVEAGKTPLVSATNLNNGIIDFVDIDPTFKAPSITVERVSGQAHVQLMDYATVPDDISVLIPLSKMSLNKLFYVSSCINLQKWMFNYGRKLSKTRLENMEIDFSNYEERTINLSSRFPPQNARSTITHNENYKSYNITKLLTIDRGDFHALDRLDLGDIPTVSRICNDNGVTGFFEKPDNAKTYNKGLITVSTVSGDAFVQLVDFIATDNVLICSPKAPFKITTLFFIAFMINKQKWRFSYGRQPYKRIFSKLNIFMPVTSGSDASRYEIDENYIEVLLKNCYGWNVIERELRMGGKTPGTRKAPGQSFITNFN